MSFLTNLDVCSQKFSGHNVVIFGRNTYLHRDYNLTKNHSSKGVGMEMSLFCVDLMWNAPETLSTTTVTDLFSLIIFFDLFQLFLKAFQ
jgi:hypothetical protein